MNQKEILTAPKIDAITPFGVIDKPSVCGALYILVMGIKIDLTGQKFNRLTVIRETSKRAKETSALWLCKCDCGNYTNVGTSDLKNGHSKSCGCIARENVIKRNIEKSTHGHTRNREVSHEYRVWAGIKSRCFNANHTYFKYYGGRGITMCSDWVHNFEAFFSCVGKSPTIKHTIDRINNNGNYEPGNVRWATAKEQANNRKNNRRYNYRGELKTAPELAEIAGIGYGIMKHRLYNNWTPEKAVKQPVKVRINKVKQ